MKNFSINKKLLTGFGSILAMLLLIVVLALLSVRGINQQIKSYAQYTLPNINISAEQVAIGSD